MPRKLKMIDLFCGAGGMSLGFSDERFGGGFKSVFAIDNDKSAVDTYNANFGAHGVQANIEDWLDGNTVPRADIVVGGPPCQGFSLLNKNRDGDSRRGLWEPYMDIVEQSGASMFLMENVPGLLKSIEFEKICQRANDMGFDILPPAVLNMANYGVPQTRKRAIAIGIKRQHFNLQELPAFPPIETHQAPGISGDLPQWETVKNFIHGLPRPKGVEIQHDVGPPMNLHFGRKPTEKSIERYKAVPKGGNRFDLQRNRPDITPQCWIRKKSGGTDLFGRLWWDRPSVTIRTEFYKPEKGRYLHPSANRPITHREGARLMSFPDDFFFYGTKVEVARQIGNAVPPIFSGKLALYAREILNTRISNKKKAA